MVRTVCAGRRLVELDGPEVGALRAEDRLSSVASAVATVRDGGGVLLITDIDALLPAAAEPVSTLILAELRNGGRHPGRRVRRDLGGPRIDRYPAAGARPVRPRAGPEPARRRDPQAAARGAAARCARQRPRARRNRRAHTGIRGRRPSGPGARGRPARGGEGQRGRQAAGPDAGGPDGCAERDPSAVAVCHRRGGRRLGDARRRRRHGRDQTGAHRGRAVAAAAPRDVRAPRRRAAARRAAVRPARLRQDVRGAGAGQFRPAVGARGQGRRADGQMGRRIGEGGARTVPPGARLGAVAGVPRRDSTRWRRGGGRASTPVSPIGWWLRC